MSQAKESVKHFLEEKGIQCISGFPILVKRAVLLQTTKQCELSGWPD